MDKLKEQLAPVIKHGFWIGTGLLLVASIVVWFLATGSLKDQNDQRTSQLNMAHTSVDSIRSEVNEHPNELSHAAMTEMIDKRRTEVLAAWESVFSRQRDILVWPERVLSREVVGQFRDKMPIEKFVIHEDESSWDVETDVRQTYARHIAKAIPAVAEIAGAKWTASMERSAGGGGEMGMERESEYGPAAGNLPVREEDAPLVQWPESSQSAVAQDLFPWLGGRPTTIQVYYSQENIWILKQLLGIVAKVNEGARLPFEAKIHKINSIAIGKSVRFDAGSIAQPGAVVSGGFGGDEMRMESGMEMDMDMDMDMESGMSGGPGAAGVSIDPTENRYVDTENKPISASDLRTALADNPGGNTMLAVAKRLPVMMSIDIDHRAVPELIATCGSVPLMVEVQQVRMLPKGASGDSGMGMEMESDMDMGMDTGMGGGRGMTAGPTADPNDPFPHDMTVQIYGLIYIYNPPNEKQIGVEPEPATDEAGLPANTAGSPPAATPVSRTTPAAGFSFPGDNNAAGDLNSEMGVVRTPDGVTANRRRGVTAAMAS